MNGKGDSIRPMSISYEQYGDNFDSIFRKKTSQGWCDVFNVHVTDPDGWDRSNFEISWNEKITAKEFWKRYNKSTVRLVYEDCN